MIDFLQICVENGLNIVISGGTGSGARIYGAIPGAVNIPVDDLRSRLDDVRALAEQGPVLVHCAVGIRGHIACRILEANGIQARNLDGGFRTWDAGQAASA